MYLSIEEVITEIAMSHDGLGWVIVEGDSDERILRNRAFPCRVKVVVGHGWEGVRNIVDGCASEDVLETKIVVGVVDRDYRDHLGCRLDNVRIIHTDYRDIENVIFLSPALGRVFSEYASAGKAPMLACKQSFDLECIRRTIYSTAVKLGRLRIYCQERSMSSSLRDLEYKKFICDRTLSIDPALLIRHLSGRPGDRLTIEDWDAAQRGVWEGDLGRDELVSNGHDVVGIVAISMRRIWGTNSAGVDCDVIGRALRGAFSDSDLYATEMWCSLVAFLSAEVERLMGLSKEAVV